ncbi:hypothetical protein YC2023_123145 [Brassica napus]
MLLTLRLKLRSSVGGTNRLQNHPRDTKNAARLRDNTMSDCRSFESKGMKRKGGESNDHRRKPWLLSLEIRKRSPTRSSCSSYRFEPGEQKRGSSNMSNRRRRQGKIHQADGASCKQPANHDLALSPETVGIHPDVDLVTGSGRNQVKTREGGAKRR